MAGPVRIFISAGESSGDFYGASIIQALRSRLPEAVFFGCGGDHMRAAGADTRVDAHEIAMVGLIEVVPGLLRAWKALRKLQAAIDQERPALAILIDFPDFNLRLATHLKRAGVPVIYFVAPQVWAWRADRLKTIRKTVDRLLCIFPFEESFFRNAGVDAEFVGHPLAGRVAPSMTAAQFRAKASLQPEGTLIALMPGSREKEILLNLPPMLEAARLIAATRPCSFILPAASTIRAAWLRQRTAGAGVPLAIVEKLTYDAVAHSQAAIVASGTASTEAALLGTPMVIVYRVSAMSWLLGRWLVHTRFYSIVNLVAGREAVPEYIQERFQPEAVAQEVNQVLDLPQVRDRIREDLQMVAKRLHRVRRDNEVSGGFSRIPGTQFVDPIQRAAAIAESILKGIVSYGSASTGS